MQTDFGTEAEGTGNSLTSRAEGLCARLGNVYRALQNVEEALVGPVPSPVSDLQPDAPGLQGRLIDMDSLVELITGTTERIMIHLSGAKGV